MPPNRPKRIVNANVVVSGWMTAQAAPSTVCLYRTLTSRHTKKNSSSRYSQSSARFSSCQEPGGSSLKVRRSGWATGRGHFTLVGAKRPHRIDRV